MAYKKPLVITGGQKEQLQLSDSLDVRAAVNPTAADDAYPNGTEWQNTVSEEVFKLIDNTSAAAVWVSLTAGGGGGFSGLTEFVLNTGTGNIDSIPCGTDPLVCIVFTGAAPVVEGIAAGASGKRVILKKVGAGNLVIKQNGSATPADNLALNTGADITLLPNESIELLYTSAGPFWVHVTSAIAPTGGGGGAVETTVIYEPSIGATTANRYKTWTEVMAAVAALIGPVTIQLRNPTPGLFQVFTVSDAGPHNLKNCRITTGTENIFPILQFADGVTLSGYPRETYGLIIETLQTTVPLYTVVDSFELSILNQSSIRSGTTATQPVIAVPATKQFSLFIDGDTSPIYKDGSGLEPIFCEGILTLTILHVADSSLFGLSNLFTNGFSGLGTINFNSYILLPGGYTATHANYDGVLNVNQREEDRVTEIATPLAASAVQSVIRNVVQMGSSSALTDTAQGISLGGSANSSGTGSIAIGYIAQMAGLRGVAIGASAGGGGAGDYAISVGFGSYAPGANVVVIGRLAQALGDGDIVVGRGSFTAQPTNSDNIIIGTFASTNGALNVLIGSGTSTTGTNKSRVVGIGQGATCQEDYTISIGGNANTRATNGIAIGKTAFIGVGSNDSIAIGRDATVSASVLNSVAIGVLQQNRISNTLKTLPVINDTKTGEGFLYSGGVETVLTCEELDMVAGTFVELTLPSGCHFYPNEVGLITSQANTVTVAGTAKFGTSVSDAAISATLAPDQTQFNRTRDVTPLTINGVTSLRATVLSAATATTFMVRPYFKGLLVKD